ncbi:helix-turn-helix domain-containing protein, partial [Vibrio campbellii]
SNVSRLEKGTGNPTIKTLMKYAKACGCQLDFGFTHV